MTSINQPKALVMIEDYMTANIYVNLARRGMQGRTQEVGRSTRERGSCERNKSRGVC